MIKVSVIIPTYNEEKDISQCLKSLKEQSFKDLEVILVDDGSTDKTLEISKKFKQVKILNQNHQGPGTARNKGAKIAKGEILIFIDADMTFDKNYVKNLVKPLFENNRLIGTTHDYERVKNISNIWSRCWGRIKIHPGNAKNVKIFRAIRKDKFLEFGGFNPKYGYADDQTFWYEKRIRPKVAEETICYHTNPETLSAVYKQSAWIGASIENDLFRIPIIKYFIPFFIPLFYPLAIIPLSLRKCQKNKDYKIFFPWMLVFMSKRYFGTIKGIFKNIYLNKNSK